MNLSPLQLLDYFVAELHFSLNSKYDSTKKLEKKLEEMEANHRSERNSEHLRTWTVVLELKYQPAVETNTPYVFSLKLVGFFKVADAYPETQVERLVQTNGPSVLYSIARELVREQTARGPDGPFILPTASFVPDKPSTVPAAATPSVVESPQAPAQSEVKPTRKTRLAPKQPPESTAT